MKKILGLLVLVSILLMMPKASAGCSHDYLADSSNGYEFLEVMGGKISLYNNRVTLNINVRFAPRSYKGCAYSFSPIRENATVKVSCQLSRYDDIILKGKMAEDMDQFSYEGMIIGKITQKSVVNDIRDYVDQESSRISCGVLDNDRILKIKIMDRR